MAAATVAALAAIGAAPAGAQGIPDGSSGLARTHEAELLAWTLARAHEAAQPASGRVEVEPGRLDPRLRLAPCAAVEPYLPAGSRPLGRTRVGLRCVDGPVRWQVSLPVTVRVMASAPVLREPLPAGTELAPEHLGEAEVDWAAQRELPLEDATIALGQRLLRSLPAGSALRAADLQPRQWFAAGDRVRIDAVGRGWRVSTEGQALTRGLDGRPARIRTESGRVVSGVAVETRRVEVAL